MGVFGMHPNRPGNVLERSEACPWPLPLRIGPQSMLPTSASFLCDCALDHEPFRDRRCGEPSSTETQCSKMHMSSDHDSQTIFRPKPALVCHDTSGQNSGETSHGIQPAVSRDATSTSIGRAASRCWGGPCPPIYLVAGFVSGADTALVVRLTAVGSLLTAW